MPFLGPLKITGERSQAPHSRIFIENASWNPYHYGLLATAASAGLGSSL